MREILVFTGNRAEYGLYFPVLRAITAHPGLEPVLVVSGSHLSPEYGRTVEEIEADGFTVSHTVPLPAGGDSVATMARSVGECISGLAGVIEAAAPDLTLVYGDRLEALACAVASTTMNVPVAHIAGGDRADCGMVDTSVRHAITKLAHLHFPTSEEARQRLLGLGEEEWRVHNFGSPAVDNILQGNYAPPDSLARELDLDLEEPVLVFTQHALTLEADRAAEQVRPALEALRDLGVQTVITYPNNDAGGRRIIREIERRAGVPHFRIRKSLGRQRYLGLLRVAAAVVGNSSSGLLETPILGLPAVNIGTRQKNRIRAGNVIDVGYDRGEIERAVRTALYDEAFREAARNCENPFGEGNTGHRIAELLGRVPLDRRLMVKEITF